MNWLDYDGEACNTARALDVLGDRWTLLVLREIFNGVRRFDDISAHLGVARDVLTRRLTALIDEGVVERRPYQEPGSRTRYEYRLTPAARDLRPMLLALMAWGEKHRSDDGPTMMLIHPECDTPIHLAIVREGGSSGARRRPAASAARARCTAHGSRLSQPTAQPA